MVSRVKRNSQNLRENLYNVEKPSSIAGEAMLRAETPEEQFKLINAGRRNFLYNGAMQVWQRGTSFNNIGGGGAAGYNADRWNATRYASGENDIGRENATDLDGFQYCLRSARGGGDTTTTARFVSQVLDKKDSYQLAGQFVTFSFYARTGAGFNGHQLNSMVRYHTDASKEERLYYNNFISATNQNGHEGVHKDVSTGWKRYTNTHYIPSNVQQVSVSINTEQNLIAAVSADYFEITGCQLEIGKIATPFEHRTYGEELALCQRYYYRITNNYAVNQNLCMGVVADTDDVFGVMDMPVTMRVAPSVTASAAASFRVTTVFGSGSSQNCSQLMLGYDGQTHVTIKARGNGGGFTAGQAKLIGFNETVGLAYIDFNAEIPSQ